jgi:hypothetical protein
MLHAYVERFDVMGGRGNILGWEEEVNKALVDMSSSSTTGVPEVLSKLASRII